MTSPRAFPRPMAIGLSLCVLVGCYHGTPEGPAPRLRSAQQVINGVRLGLSESEVRGQVGAPDSVGRSVYEGRGAPEQVWHYGPLEVGFRQHRVELVECRARGCRTPDGLAVGDSIGRAKALYGPGMEFFLDNTYGSIYYRQQGRYDCVLDVVQNEARVIGLRLLCDTK